MLLIPIHHESLPSYVLFALYPANVVHLVGWFYFYLVMHWQLEDLEQGLTKFLVSDLIAVDLQLGKFEELYDLKIAVAVEGIKD